MNSVINNFNILNEIAILFLIKIKSKLNSIKIEILR